MWKSMLEQAFCCYSAGAHGNSNDVCTHKELEAFLEVPVTPVEVEIMRRNLKRIVMMKDAFAVKKEVNVKW